MPQAKTLYRAPVRSIKSLEETALITSLNTTLPCKRIKRGKSYISWDGILYKTILNSAYCKIVGPCAFNKLTAYDGRVCAVISLPNLCDKAKLYRAEHSSLALTVLDPLPAS